MSNQWQDQGIILSVRPHGENGGIVSLLTRDHGRHMGYVYGATSSRMRGVLEIGNLVSVEWRAKQSDQLGNYVLELEKGYAAAIMQDSLRLTALQSACVLTDKTLPERETHRALFDGFLALLQTFDEEIWPAAYIYWEMGLLRELGFGIDLTRCVASGTTDDLIYVSPKSGCAVSAVAGEPYKDKLLPLPGFLKGAPDMQPEDILQGLQLTGHFLLNRVFSLANVNLPDARLRLEEKYTV